MKDTYYFQHDYHARHDIKLEAMIADLKMEGLGVYWCIIEMLYEENGYIPVSFSERIANALRTHSDLVKSLIGNYGLFKDDGTRFWSESVLRRLDERREKSEKARKSALSKYQGSERKRTHSERKRTRAIKESKVKEKKVKDIKLSPNGEEATLPQPNVEVDKILAKLKEVTGLSNLDGSQQINRRYAYNLFRKWKDIDAILKGIEVGAQNDYHRARMTSVKYLYYHLAEMAREVAFKKPKTKIAIYEPAK